MACVKLPCKLWVCTQLYYANHRNGIRLSNRRLFRFVWFFWFFSPLPGKMISMSAASGVAEVTPESSWKRRIAVVVDCCSEKLREE